MSAIVRPRSARAWLLAARPQTLLVGVVPVLLGAAAAARGGSVRVAACAAALFGAILIQVGTNLANDVFDHEKGADTAARIGPTRVTQAGLLSARDVRRAMIAAFALASLVGVYLTAIGGPVIVAIGVASIGAGIAYTAGPYPLGYLGLGEVFAFAFFGPIAVVATAYVGGGRVDAFSVGAGAGAGAIAAAVLVVNNVRDIETDVVAHKRTLAVRFGRPFGVVEFACLLLVAEALPVALVLTRHLGPAGLVTLLTAPWATSLVRTLARSKEGPTLNRCLGSTARLLAVYGVLLAAAAAVAPR